MPTINETQRPENLESAIQTLFDTLTPEDKDFIKSNEAITTHFSFGMALRNAWGLWKKETPIVDWFITNFGIGHGDDISGIILEGLWCKVKGTDFDPQIQVERYKEHWRKSGVDPVTQERK